ncbi:tyrosine-type recombinase/integrase [Stenotrophomonas maltophilia]|uniref:tyrosine-type recombinase/integrase n=1 Tax=Stenotrophomonas maltophilia TaxID=40324 RepID=UPI001FD6BA1E|nr:tyrosine-type recombinase/integrase [Stenotrophomonas maltophilia]
MTERLRTVQLVPQPTRERSFSRSASCHPASRKFLAACNDRSIESTVFAESGTWREVLPNRYARWALRHLPDPLVAVHKDTVSDWFASDAKRAGIGGSLHRLRHTFCAHMVMAGVPLRRVQILAGHADDAATEKFYAHLTHEGDDGAVAKLRY